MRDILAGGDLQVCDQAAPIGMQIAYARRQRVARARAKVRVLPVKPASTIQPGQLTSPLLKFGFPSLSLH